MGLELRNTVVLVHRCLIQKLARFLDICIIIEICRPRYIRGIRGARTKVAAVVAVLWWRHGCVSACVATHNSRRRTRCEHCA
jgi:hypothetical protein